MHTYNRADAQFSADIDNRCLYYCLRPLGRFHVPWFPSFLGNNTMNFQIFRARTDVEPVPVIKNYTANPSALTDPLNENWNERDFLAGRDPWENLRIPHGYIRIIKILIWVEFV